MNKEQILIEGISKIAKEVISFTSSRTEYLGNTKMYKDNIDEICANTIKQLSMEKEIIVECTDDYTKKLIVTIVFSSKSIKKRLYEDVIDLLIQNSPGPVSNTFVFIINKEMWKDLQEILQKYWGKYECEKNTYSVIGNNFIFKLKE